jgi:outer membrane protein assembly factor BamB
VIKAPLCRWLFSCGSGARWLRGPWQWLARIGSAKPGLLRHARPFLLLHLIPWLLWPGNSLRGEDWGTFLGPRGDGTSSETGIDPALWTPHPPLVWKIELGTSYGGPAIVGDELLQFDRFGNNERLTCYDVETATEKWRWEYRVEYDDMYGYNNGPRCSPVVVDGRIFLYGVAGQLSCVDLATGKPVWTKDTAREYGVVPNFFGVASSPFVFDGKLLVMVGGSPSASARLPSGRLDLVKPNGSAIVAFDCDTGKELYRVGDDLASYSAVAVRELHGKPVGLAFLRGGLLAWDPGTGKELFQYPWRAQMLESVNAAQPVTLGNQVLLSEAYGIGSVLLDVDEHFQPSVVWQDSGPRNSLKFRAHWSTPVIVGDYLYGCNGRNQPDSDLRCVRVSDGQVQWTHRRHERSSLLAVDDHLIVLGEYGRLELIKPSPDKLEVVAECDLSEVIVNGQSERWLEYPCWAPPSLSNGKLYIRGNRHLLCLQVMQR